jgi:hypothetical protein
MDISGAGNKILDPLEKYASLIGGGVAAIANIGYYQEDIEAFIHGTAHAPEWNNIVNFALQNPNMQSALILAIGGFLAKEVVPGQMLKKIATVAEKGAFAWYAVQLASAGIYYCTHSPSMGEGKSSYNPVQGTGTGTTLNQRAHQGNRTTNYTGRPTAGSGYTGRAQQRMGN